MAAKDHEQAGMPKQADCRRGVSVDDGGAAGKGKPDEMNDPSKMPPPATVDSVIVPMPLESSLQHSHLRQLTNCIQDIHEVYHSALYRLSV